MVLMAQKEKIGHGAKEHNNKNGIILFNFIHIIYMNRIDTNTKINIIGILLS